jgi:hypothetical protein
MPQNTKSPGEGGLSEGRENDPQGNSIVPTPLELVKARLEERGCLFGSGQDWQCPNHDDETASLGVTESVDGKVLLKCQAGCETLEVVNALGLDGATLTLRGDRNLSTATKTKKTGSCSKQFAHRMADAMCADRPTIMHFLLSGKR